MKPYVFESLTDYVETKLNEEFDINKNIRINNKSFTKDDVIDILCKYIFNFSHNNSYEEACKEAEEFLNDYMMNESLTEAEHKHNPKAHLRNRGDVIFPAGSSKVKDDADHFPINSVGQGRNALARSGEYKTVPSWYRGTLAELVAKVKSRVHGKYPSIDKK